MEGKLQNTRGRQARTRTITGLSQICPFGQATRTGNVAYTPALWAQAPFGRMHPYELEVDWRCGARVVGRGLQPGPAVASGRPGRRYSDLARSRPARFKQSLPRDVGRTRVCV